jgi:hypothetical protein
VAHLKRRQQQQEVSLTLQEQHHLTPEIPAVVVVYIAMVKINPDELILFFCVLFIQFYILF